MTDTLPLWWQACVILLIISLLLLHRWSRSAGIVMICLTRLPGVVLHELAHLLAGILLRAQPTGFSLIPRRRPDGRWTLGSVSFRRVTAANAVPIALAPLGLIPLAWGLYRCWFDWRPVSLANTLLLYTTLFLLVGNALPSGQDLRVACNGKSLLLYGCVGTLLGYLWLQLRG